MYFSPTKPSIALTNLNKSLQLEGNCSNLSPCSVNGYQECEASTERILYDDFEFRSTITTEFNLVCDQQYKVSFNLNGIYRTRASSARDFYCFKPLFWTGFHLKNNIKLLSTY